MNILTMVLCPPALLKNSRLHVAPHETHSSFLYLCSYFLKHSLKHAFLKH